MIRLDFSIDLKMPSFNDIIAFAKQRGRGIRYSKMKKAIDESILSCIKNNNYPLLKNIKIELEWREAHKRRDPDNVASAVKFILDSMVKAGIIRNDSYKYVSSINHSFIYGAKKNGVDVTVSGDLDRYGNSPIR